MDPAGRVVLHRHHLFMSHTLRYIRAPMHVAGNQNTKKDPLRILLMTKAKTKNENGQSDQPSFFGRGHPYSGHVLRHRIHLSWLLGLRQGELHLRTGLRTHTRRVHESFRERLCGENRLSRVRTPTRTRRIQLLGMPDNAIPTRAAHHPPRGFANLGRRRRRVDASRPVADSLRRTTGRTRSREISHRDRIALATSGD